MERKDPEAGRPTLDPSGRSDPASPPFETSGPANSAAGENDSVGPYRLLHKLGEGGMGQVWLAEQASPVKRLVALKLILGGRFSQDALARFHLEQQALAMMEHPSIAKVFDAGTTTDGQPYFVMEYVPGEPITDYCDRKRLSIAQRLELLVRVCEGVQHAHQKAIMHRDLKPSNILVVETDGRPTPRIIDFGTAKSLSSQSSGGATLTGVGRMVGTPGYISPEQADPAIVDVDTRADVYSLGVVLYELLSGYLPFDPNQWQGKNFWDAVRQLKEEDPPRPSTKVASDTKLSTPAAGNRQTEAPQLVSMLRGDLDWITARALEKDRERRYGTPAELAADIRRFLAHEPIVARPPSRAYRIRKYVQRHKIGVAAGVALVVLLVTFALLQSVNLRRVTRERDRADRVTQFMVGLFKVSNPSQARGNTVTAREILDKGAKDIEAGLTGEPQVQADLMRAMAQSYDGLGLYSRARDLMHQVFDIQRSTLGPHDRKTLESMSFLGSTMLSSGQSTEALKWLQDTLSIQQKVLGPKDHDTLTTRRYLCDALYAESNFQNAEHFARETLALDNQVLGPENPETLDTMSRLAETLELQAHYPEAEKLNREVLDTERRTLGADDPATLQSMDSLAKVLIEEGNYSRAETILNQALTLDRRILGAEHAHTLDALGNLAYVHLKEGKYPEAETLYRELVDTEARMNGPESIDNVADMEELAVTYARQGRYRDASQLFHQAIDITEKNKETSLTNIGWYNFACAAAIAGRRDEAFDYLHEAISRGFVYPDAISTDRDLTSLHSDPRFAPIVEEARARAAALQPK
ncbi:MAG TPA: serine/threonine-protein kinase [Terriglobia bacterium]|nr:serine/threonine-protein kinase [Terriglobia bacterium]